MMANGPGGKPASDEDRSLRDGPRARAADGTTDPTGNAEPKPPGGSADGKAFRALQHRDFRLYWFGSVVSLLGSQMSNLANSWQVYRLTHNALMLGLTGLFSLGPMILFSLYGGVVADAVDRRLLMIFTQAILLCSSGVLAAATFSGRITVWLIFGMAAVNGAVMAFNNPARSALVANLVPREHLASAISLSTSGRQLATIIGPSLAGVIIGEASARLGSDGIGVAYAIDGVSFLAVIGALALLRTPLKPAEGSRISIAAAVEGLQFVFRNPILMSAMLLDFCATFCGSSEALMPIFAMEFFHVGARGLGFLMAAPSLGALLGALALSNWGHIRRQGVGVLWGVAFYGLAWIAFGLSRHFWLGWLALAGTGAADAVNMVMRQTISQTITPDELRGRMTSVNMIFFMGGPRLGEFESGLVARFSSAPIAALAGGAGVLLVTALIALRTPALREYRA